MRQFLWVWMLLMALAFVNDRCHCCLQEERSGLLEIKAWFTHVGAGSDDLQGWDKEDFNCCNWDWISCDSTTNRVIELDLSDINDDALEKDLYLNASLFLPFKELEILDLGWNQLVGGLKDQEDKFVYKRRLAFVVCEAEGALLRMRQFLWVWMLLMALAFVNDRCHCCLQEERSGLLEIKAWFGHAGAASFWLEDWDKEDLNCCYWDWVECDKTTNRVIQLHLSYVNYDALEDLYLNASLFLPFKELEFLDLSGNHLVGGLKNQGSLLSILFSLHRN
ncbi:hypothetical protein DKX38_006929 [Salix brachista]|uniref:Leucine-rich repeat-containing N-terminal plant-type domain-containing protein n=1 Tax=Salix brachista TaxID=2182728 RepID=A0A5N5MLH0_9ROSI|nr:hypothetical protein DKX38_006929 [Salix brachista]